MQREYFYTLGRVREQEGEAWALGGELMKRGNGRYSSVRSLYFALSLRHDPEQVGNDDLINEVFKGDKYLAYKDLVNYWLRSKRERFPRGVVAQEIDRLAKELNVNDRNNPLKNPNMSRITGFEK